MWWQWGILVLLAVVVVVRVVVNSFDHPTRYTGSMRQRSGNGNRGS